MNTYSCEPCMKFFNGKLPYESHLASVKHRKKVNESASIIQNFKNCNFDSSNWEKEPFIISLEKDYKCTLCKTLLNSVDQVRSHINGGKHLKAKASFSFFTSSNVLSHNQSHGQVNSNLSSSATTKDSLFQFDLHIDDIQELVENIKVFKPNDRIVFYTI